MGHARNKYSHVLYLNYVGQDRPDHSPQNSSKSSVSSLLQITSVHPESLVKGGMIIIKVGLRPILRIRAAAQIWLVPLNIFFHVLGFKSVLN